jgi:DNA polymerase
LFENAQTAGDVLTIDPRQALDVRVRGYGDRVTTMLEKLREEAARCTACDLYKHATQVVFGEGPESAPLMLMGEVPGDKEDKAGHPFVGPAGKILDDALVEAGIDRTLVYVTNAVKHFKWVPARGGKVRLHKKPNHGEIAACNQWWQRELAVVQPQVLGLLGATAAQAVLGSKFRVTKERGRWFELDRGVNALPTIHPSAILRAQDRRDEEYAGFVRDLRLIANRLDS